MKLGSSPALMNNQSVMCYDIPTMIYKHNQGNLYPLKLVREYISTNGKIDLSNATFKESVKLVTDRVLKIDCSDYHKMSLSPQQNTITKNARSLWFWDDDGGSAGDDFFGWDDDWGDDFQDDDFFDWLISFDDWNDDWGFGDDGDDDWGFGDDDWFGHFLGYDDDKFSSESLDDLLFPDPMSWAYWESTSIPTDSITQLSMDIGLSVVSKYALGPQFSLSSELLKTAITPVVEAAVVHYCSSCKPILDVVYNVNMLTVSISID